MVCRCFSLCFKKVIKLSFLCNLDQFKPWVWSNIYWHCSKPILDDLWLILKYSVKSFGAHRSSKDNVKYWQKSPLMIEETIPSLISRLSACSFSPFDVTSSFKKTLLIIICPVLGPSSSYAILVYFSFYCTFLRVRLVSSSVLQIAQCRAWYLAITC